MFIKKRTEIEKRWLAMKNEYQTWVPGWRDIQRFIRPSRGFFEGQVPNFGRTIDAKTQLDSAPQRALRTLASGFISGFTSPSSPWFKLGLQNEDLMQDEGVKEWLDIAEQKLYTIFARCNIYGAFHPIYEELGGFGTAAVLIEENFDTVISPRSFTIGEYFLGQSSDRKVNAFGRLYWMTSGQLVQEFGIENVSPQVQAIFKNGHADYWRQVCHLIEPNDQRIPDRKDFENKNFRSVQWEYGSPIDTCLRIGGYDDFPVLAPRWLPTTSANNYGFGPGHEALGDVKMLMKMQNDFLVALDKVIDPPLVQDAMVQGDKNTLPGGVTKISSTVPNAGIRTAYQIQPDLAAMQAKIDRVTESIDETFYKDLFRMISNLDQGNITATEINERLREKMMQLGPVLQRIESELLSPLISRTFGIAMRSGVIPIPPEIVQGQDLKIEYISMLAQAQKAVGTGSIQDLIAFVSNMAQFKPDALDNVDFDEAIREWSKMRGVPAKIVLTPQIIAQIRQVKEKQMQMAQMGEEATKAADGAKTLSETKLGTGSALDALAGNPEQPQEATRA